MIHDIVCQKNAIMISRLGGIWCFFGFAFLNRESIRRSYSEPPYSDHELRSDKIAFNFGFCLTAIGTFLWAIGDQTALTFFHNFFLVK